MPKKKIAKQNGNGQRNLRELLPNLTEDEIKKLEEFFYDMDPVGQEGVLISLGPLDDPKEWMTTEEIHRELARRRGGLVDECPDENTNLL
jgi:hypothetical protein